ncbi:MAG: DEAD/DEAH box helicase [Planctomycetota bacterium]|nr:DEAD/DEAH box helicase [Planctomycetota bacterium]
MRFSELGLSEPINRAVASEGYTTPTPIQAKAIPEILAGNDVLGCAQTGTGKTGAFALPILHRLGGPLAQEGQGPENQRKKKNNQHGRNRRGKQPFNQQPSQPGKPRALILCPTRELAMQIFESFITYGRHTRLRHTVVFGGVSQHHQVRKLRSGIDVLVATPGRLLDLMNQGHIDLRSVEILVLDEADRMLDMGFIHDIRKIVEKIPTPRQTLMFSATMPREIRKLADSVLVNPVSIEVAPEATTVDAIDQYIYRVDRKNKGLLLSRILCQDNVKRALVFTRTKHGVDKLVKVLKQAGIDAGAIHSNKTQNARTRALQAFKNGRVPVLIATDIASRGIDVEEITHVVNFDMPYEPDTYVHRIGRTARAGASGIALSFCDHDEHGFLKSIERKIKKELEVLEDHPDLALQAPPKRWEKGGNHSPKKSYGGKPHRGRGRNGSGSNSSSGSNSGKRSRSGRTRKAYASNQGKRR